MCRNRYALSDAEWPATLRHAPEHIVVVLYVVVAQEFVHLLRHFLIVEIACTPFKRVGQFIGLCSNVCYCFGDIDRTILGLGLIQRFIKLRNGLR